MTTDQNEILVIMAEECAEVIQDSMKMIRFGNTEDNLRRLTVEVAQLEYMITLFKQRFNIDLNLMANSRIEKEQKLQVYSSIFEYK